MPLVMEKTSGPRKTSLVSELPSDASQNETLLADAFGCHKRLALHVACSSQEF